MRAVVACPASIAFAAIVFVSMLSTSACVRDPLPSVPSEPPGTCPAMTTITRVQILLPPGSAALRKNAYNITDPQTVRHLVDFVNQRRIVSPPGADIPPYPKVRATFYDGHHHVAIFGSGSGIFYLQCTANSQTNRGTRYASAIEMDEFEMLAAPPNP
jgi:hypothetical protein